jgi:hypothetical protein
MRPATGEGDVAGVGGHGVGSLGQYHPDVAIVVFVERYQDASLREFTGLWTGVDVMELIPHR